MTTVPNLPMYARALSRRDAPAIEQASGSWTYGQLADSSVRFAAKLLDGRPDLDSARVAFMASPGADYVVMQWAIWLAGGIAVPLCLSHPGPELEYALRETGAEIVVFSAEFRERLEPVAEGVGARVIAAADSGLAATAGSVAAPSLPEIAGGRPAMILFTSGTTGRPKGVVLTHSNIEAQIKSLVEAWAWSPQDRILNVLPLHHTHGIVNVLCCALWSGAVCRMMPTFDADEVWNAFLSGRLTLFMAVPTIYVRLIRAWEEAPAELRGRFSQAVSELRLMVSGSAALPVSVLEKWKTISGHVLLERYGMTEMGMALSNPLIGDRRPGHVGIPLPGVGVRLRDESGGPVADGDPGEIQVKGPTVFSHYWGRPEETANAFLDGWFRTGDMAVVSDGYYRILGRSSVDIIKTGGYKVSALEIEEVIRTHSAVSECAVVGVPDAEWGERVCAALVCRAGCSVELGELRQWARERMAPYKIPTKLVSVEDLPRNAMGKVTKPEVAKFFI